MKRNLLIWGSVIYIPLVAIVLQLVSNNFLEDVPFLFFYAAVALSTAVGGLRTGLISTIILSVYHSTPVVFDNEFPISFISAILFFFEAVLVSIIIDYYKKSDVISVRDKKIFALQKELKQLEKKYAQAQDDIRVRDEFLSIASHELKTPLTSMLLQVQTALHNIKNVSLADFSVAKLLKMLERAEEQTKSLSRIINDLLNVSRITSKRLTLQPEQFNITELVEKVVESFSENGETDEYKISFSSDGDIIGKWDKVRIEQAITNLLSNATKYGDSKPISVKVANGKSVVNITVKDQGIGIAKKDKEKIFALFERGTKNRESDGLGVGLYITDQIIKAHGGKLSVKSKKGKGSEFTISLPVIKSSVKKKKAE